VGLRVLTQREALSVLTYVGRETLSHVHIHQRGAYYIFVSTNVGLVLFSSLQIDKDYVVVNTRNTTYKTISLHTWTYIRYLTMDQH